jgi:hypothetical protein
MAPTTETLERQLGHDLQTLDDDMRDKREQSPPAVAQTGGKPPEWEREAHAEADRNRS